MEIVGKSVMSFGSPPREAADVSVARRDGRWWMAVPAMRDQVIEIFEAVLPAGAPLTSDEWQVGDEPLVPAPPADARDGTCYHCPSYANGRIYYASCPTWSLYGPYQIGCLQWDGTAWHRHPRPVFTATEPWEHGTVLEPNPQHRN